MQDLLQASMHDFPGAWRLLPDHALPRLRLRIGCVLVTDRAILVFATTRSEAEAAAIDLADFHAGCEGLPVLPVALLNRERVVAQEPLPFPGAAPILACTRLLLPGLLARVAGFSPLPGFDPAAWAVTAYRPVPGLVRAACDLYSRHGETSLRLVNSGRGALAATQAAIADIAEAARQAGRKQVIFVTGQPGAGKTLCGLDAAFAPGAGSAFLTGNPALLHVLREALVRDAVARGMGRKAAVQRISAVIQPLHGFRDQYAESGVPPDSVLVIDEAQRCWNAAYAVRKTTNKSVRLRLSEPGHILEIMGRREGFCLVLCLLGGGQEIHAGEGGIAEWGLALAANPGWSAAAPPHVQDCIDGRQRLADVPGLTMNAALRLGDPVRSFRAPRLVAWVDAVLADDVAGARDAAGLDPPVTITRSLPAMRMALRHERWRAGLLASAGGRRLRAEGLGGLLWHQDEDAVARWFLDRWPDIRSSDALEVAATEFGVQGLELDQAGLCWDLDLARADGRWSAHGFRATAWSRPLAGEARSNKLNAYRVLLTRARRRTVIWVPRGAAHDATRDPDRYDAIADFLIRCGAGVLDEPVAAPQHGTMHEAALL